MYPLGETNPTLLSQGILWWVSDIPGCNVDDGIVGYEYQMPLPLYGSGKGKYVFLVYEQSSDAKAWSEETLVPAT